MAAASKKEGKSENYRELRDLIYTFFYYSNKPVSVTEVCLQFKSYKKADVEKVLADLEEKKKIFKKQYNKNKIYCLSQEMEFTIDDPEYTDEIDAQQDQKVEDKVVRFLLWKRGRLGEYLRDLKSRCAELDEVLSGRELQLSTDELKKAIESMESFISKNKSMEEIELLSTKDVEEQKQRMKKIEKELQSRRRLYKEVIDVLSEGLEIKKKDLLLEAGIDE